MRKKEMDIETKRFYARLIFKWCKKNMGVNKRKKPPSISVLIRFKCDEDRQHVGFYSDDNRIVIYDSLCPDMETLVSTIVHEYTHYLQSMKKYWEFFKTHNYENHPYEQEARKNEKIYTKPCMKDIKINYGIISNSGISRKKSIISS